MIWLKLHLKKVKLSDLEKDSIEDRQISAKIMYENGYSIEEIENFLQKKERTVKNYIKHWDRLDIDKTNLINKIKCIKKTKN